MVERTIFQPASGGSVRPGARLNGIYEIETLIAEGGMGEVYKGFNIQTRDLVAIKMIRPDLSRNPDAFALFRREASTLHNLQHEAIVRYFVFSVDPDLQRAYLAMEFVDGPSLAKRLASGRLPLAEVKILQRRIGDALEAAHRLGVVHRDISSDNVILPDGDVRRAKIIDFGIARSHRPGEGTIIGDGFAGKYNYVSPEQVGLAGGEVAFKSDIYSFGLVLAEALRGRPIDMSGSPADVIEKRRAVPDLSDIDASMRPLLQAMLQPLPANRPPSMAAVAAWGDSGAGRDGRGTPPSRGSSGGRAAAIVGALIVIVSVGGTAYVFRDDAAQWFKSAPPVVGPNSAPAPTALPLPPLGSAETPPSPTAVAETPSGGGMPTAAPTAAATTAPSHVPTSVELVDALPPRASQALVALPPAMVGEPYRDALPAFADPGGKGVRLGADALPGGLTFRDLGGGQGEIDGVPTQAGESSLQVVATNHNGLTAQMTATLVIKDRPAPVAATPAPTVAAVPKAPPLVQNATSPATSPPSPAPTVAVIPKAPPLLEASPSPVPVPASTPPRPSQAVAVVDGAMVDEDYSSALPPFNVGVNARGLALRAEPNPPEGLTFVDLGSGLSQISGKPTRPGAFAFDVVATNAAGLSARMAVKLVVALRARPEPNPAAAPTLDKATAFLDGFDGGACFLVRPLPGARSVSTLQGVGVEIAPFQRFDASYTREVGVEPQLGLRLIAAAECPALDLIRLGSANGAAAPRIALANYDVGRGKPLAGTIANLGGRRLALLLVDNDGIAHRLEAKTLAGGDSATFSVPLVADAASIGPLQIVLAIASAKPLAALEGLRSAALKDIAPRLIDEAKAGSASVEAEFFKLAR